MTITSYPPDFASVNSPLIWVLYDANAIDPLKLDYKYVAEVWIDGVKVYTERAYPRPSGAFGVFDMSAIIRGYVSALFNPTTGVEAQEMGEAEFRTAAVELKVREEYNGEVTAIVLEDDERIFYNHYNDRQEGIAGISAFVGLTMTTRERVINLTRSCTAYYLPYFSSNTGTFDVVIDGDTTSITPAVAGTCQLINIAPIGIDPGTDSYEVVIGEETYRVNIICPGMYQNYYVHFLNKYGGFETMLFNKVRKQQLDIERKEFKQQPYRIDDSGAVSFGTSAALHEQRTQFAGRYTEKLSIQTDFLTDSEYQWLAQLVCSPMVYLEDNGIVYPVMITNNNYEFKEYIVDMLTTLSLDIEFASSINTQYR